MKFKFTIARKLGLGFGILTLAMLFNSYMIYSTLNINREISDKNTTIYTPSVTELNNLYVLINNSKMLIKNWVYIERKENTHDKQKLKKLHKTEFKEVNNRLKKLSQKWPVEDREAFINISKTIEDTLFAKHKFIMKQLNDFSSYDDALITFTINPMVEENGEVIMITDDILTKLEQLFVKLQNKSNEGDKEMIESFNGFQQFIIFSGIILFIVALLIASFTITSIVKPVNILKKTLLKMSKGILPEKEMKVKNDEIGEMSNALNELIKGLKSTSEFSLEIGKGNFNMDFQPLSEHDTLGNSLINMRKDLMAAAKKENERKKEDEQRNWVTRGLAKFADILRQNNDDLEELSYNIISNLVKYMEANQGGMFILNDDDKEDPYLELSNAYAYNRKKFLQKEVKKGEGLVGTCLVEKQTIYMTNIPDSYLNITSGLGKANPRSLLIVPLKVNEEIYGVLEIASFDKFEKYQIEFVEKVAESIASTISSVKINTTTARLLRESKEQGEQLIQQEEEMRQNLEELQSTQEESNRKIWQLETFLEAVEEHTLSYELDIQGSILNMNDAMLHLLGIALEDIEGRDHQMLLSIEEMELEQYTHSIQEVQKGEKVVVENAYETPKGTVWLKETFIPIKNVDGNYDKIYSLAFNITNYKSHLKQN